MDFANMLNMLTTFAVTWATNLLWAIVIFVVGRWIAGFASRNTPRFLKRFKVGETLAQFASNLVYVGLLIFTILAALDQLGIETTSFIALLGGAGLAIGLALEGGLANFAAGVMILLFKPFEVGDLVEMAGEFGHVEKIQIFNTIVITLDNKTVIIPNAQITGNNITNYSRKGYLRLDLVIGISYGDDIRRAKTVLNEILEAEPLVLADPKPVVAVYELGDNSVNLAVRPYVDTQHYWPAHFALMEAIKLRFDEEGISFPFPQRDVHLFQTA
jgi:small conductance mechanosensitive channel